MRSYFANCTTPEEAKALYRSLAKTLHPDGGGSTEEFQLLQEEYERCLHCESDNIPPTWVEWFEVEWAQNRTAAYPESSRQRTGKPYTEHDAHAKRVSKGAAKFMNLYSEDPKVRTEAEKQSQEEFERRSAAAKRGAATKKTNKASNRADDPEFYQWWRRVCPRWTEKAARSRFDLMVERKARATMSN